MFDNALDFVKSVNVILAITLSSDMSRKVVFSDCTPPSLAAVNPLGNEVVRRSDPFGANTAITAFIILFFSDSSSIVYFTFTLTWFASVFVRVTKLELPNEITIPWLFCANEECVETVVAYRTKTDKTKPNRIIYLVKLNIVFINQDNLLFLNKKSFLTISV
jgi:hypothetical protein